MTTNENDGSLRVKANRVNVLRELVASLVRARHMTEDEGALVLEELAGRTDETTSGAITFTRRDSVGLVTASGNSPSPRYVYVAEQGCYSSRGVVGVYATPEAAMEAHPVPVAQKYDVSREGGWMPDDDAEPGYRWSNGLDWDSGMDITRYALESVGPSVEAVARELWPMIASHAAWGRDEEAIQAIIAAFSRTPGAVSDEDSAIDPHAQSDH